MQVAALLFGARACRATTAAELRDALSGTRDHPGPVVIVVPVVPHADLPGAGVWWDVAPAEVSALETTAGLRPGVRSGTCPASGGSVERRIRSARHRPYQCGLDGKAAQPRVPGRPCRLSRAEDPAQLVHAADTAADRAGYARDVLGYARA